MTGTKVSTTWSTVAACWSGGGRRFDPTLDEARRRVFRAVGKVDLAAAVGTDDDADETSATEEGCECLSVCGSMEVETIAPSGEQSQFDGSTAEPEKASDGGGGIGLDGCCRDKVKAADRDGTRVWMGRWIRSRDGSGRS